MAIETVPEWMAGLEDEDVAFTTGSSKKYI